MNSSSLCSLAGRYENPIPTRFLAPIDCLKIPAQCAQFVSPYFFLSMRQLLGNQKQTNLTNLLYSKNKAICSIFAFVFFGSTPSPGNHLSYEGYTRSKKTQREVIILVDAAQYILDWGELEPNKTTAKERGPLRNTITIFPLGKVFLKIHFEIQAEKERNLTSRRLLHRWPLFLPGPQYPHQGLRASSIFIPGKIKENSYLSFKIVTFRHIGRNAVFKGKEKLTYFFNVFKYQL